MSRQADDLWAVVWGRPHVDPAELAAAIDAAAPDRGHDTRTRMLIRESLDALRRYWGPDRFEQWIARRPGLQFLGAVSDPQEGKGFPSLYDRLMAPTSPDTISQFLRELGLNAPTPTELMIGGSIALILDGSLRRATEDIDVVDEVPAALRQQHALLDTLVRRYGLRLAHFQSHYLPTGWRQRVHLLGRFGKLEVYLVDRIDIFLSKLFSAREKDRDDLRVLVGQIDQAAIVARLPQCGAMAGEATLRKNAAENWYILFGEALPA